MGKMRVEQFELRNRVTTLSGSPRNNRTSTIVIAAATYYDSQSVDNPCTNT